MNQVAAKYVTILLSIFTTTCIYAQDISGRWTGKYESRDNVLNNFEKLIVEINVLEDNRIKGTSELIYTSGAYEKYELSGFFNPSKSTIYLSEDREVYTKGPNAYMPGHYEMTLITKNNGMRMEGRWDVNSMRSSHKMAVKPSHVWLEKITPEKKQQPNIDIKKKPVIDNNLSRRTNIQKTIRLDKSELNNIKIEFTDNERIDNDIISVYINGEQKISKKSISESPLTLDFNTLSKETVILISAESYGNIPPCTALMTITTNKKKYIIELASTFSSNAAVRFIISQ